MPPNSRFKGSGFKAEGSPVLSYPFRVQSKPLRNCEFRDLGYEFRDSELNEFYHFIDFYPLIPQYLNPLIPQLRVASTISHLPYSLGLRSHLWHPALTPQYSPACF
jgi:hypothetical protein